MADGTMCSVCVRASELGVNPDTSQTKTKWAELLGVSESSVRRHFKHGPIPRLGKNAPKTTPTAPPSVDLTDAPTHKESWKGDIGEISVVLTEKLDHNAILEKFGYTPNEVHLDGLLEEMHWQVANGEWRHKYRFKTSRPSAADDELTINDLPLLYSQITSREIPPVYKPDKEGRAVVVVWADVQVGKTGSRGGTPELIARVHEKREKLRRYLLDNPADEAFFLSVGDEVESFENTGQQAFTNDLSFPDQLDLELTFELDMITDLASHYSHVTVSGCSSNHCSWRKGKSILGKPKDDYGLYIKRQLEKALRLNQDYDKVEFIYPDDWDETVVVDVQGTKIGLAHGHQVNRPDGIEAWWTKQTFGAQPTADADILLTGHFHTFRAQQMGRSRASGLNRWHLQAPTLDNGSDWYRNISGSDTDAGMLVFCVDSNGLDMQSLTIL